MAPKTETNKSAKGNLYVFEIPAIAKGKGEGGWTGGEGGIRAASRQWHWQDLGMVVRFYYSS